MAERIVQDLNKIVLIGTRAESDSSPSPSNGFEVCSAKGPETQRHISGALSRCHGYFVRHPTLAHFRGDLPLPAYYSEFYVRISELYDQRTIFMC